MTVKVEGVETVKLGFDILRQSIFAKVQDACAISAEKVRSRTVIGINIQKPNPGAKPRGKRKHIPGPPGGPPNSDYGNLSARYTTTTVASRTHVESRVVSGVKYARWLEYGTTKMPARPHLLPEFDKERPEFRKRLNAAKSAGVAEANKKMKGGRK